MVAQIFFIFTLNYLGKMNPFSLIFFRWGEHTNHFLVDQNGAKFIFSTVLRQTFCQHWSKMRLPDEKCPYRDIDSIHTMYGLYGNDGKAFLPSENWALIQDDANLSFRCNLSIEADMWYTGLLTSGQNTAMNWFSCWNAKYPYLSWDIPFNLGLNSRSPSLIEKFKSTT